MAAVLRGSRTNRPSGQPRPAYPVQRHHPGELGHAGLFAARDAPAATYYYWRMVLPDIGVPSKEGWQMTQLNYAVRHNLYIGKGASKINGFDGFYLTRADRFQVLVRARKMNIWPILPASPARLELAYS